MFLPCFISFFLKFLINKILTQLIYYRLFNTFNAPFNLYILFIIGLIYYFTFFIALLIRVRALSRLKLSRSSGVKTSNNSASIREFISPRIAGIIDLHAKLLYKPLDAILNRLDTFAPFASCSLILRKHHAKIKIFTQTIV